jgi:hypothetical protein
MPDQTDTNNAAALNAVAAAITALDPVIGRYDDLNQQKTTLESALAESQQLEKTTLDDESLVPRRRNSAAYCRPSKV